MFLLNSDSFNNFESEESETVAYLVGALGHVPFGNKIFFSP